MFVALANELAKLPKGNPVGFRAAAETILRLDAATVSFLMEAAWSRGGPGLLTGVSAGDRIPAPNPAPVGIFLNDRSSGGFPLLGTYWDPVWDHLIYAYMIENTRAYGIMGRVISEYAQGERLGILGQDSSYQWLHTTEELFYKDASPYQPYNLISRVRPDIGGTRRNAYYRMFGMDLNHGRDGGSGYQYFKPPVANREFVATFEEFLRQVWRAIENANNQVANNPTDRQAIQDLALRLQTMLNARRGGAFDRPNLAREEFLSVCLAAWLDLTLSFDAPIVRELSAGGPSPEERLRQVGERVGLPAHGRSHSYFIISRQLSVILIALEEGGFNDEAGAETLFAPGNVRALVSGVIHHWSLISGRDMKSQRTTPSPALTASTVATASAPAMAQTSMATVASTGGNGKVPVGQS